MKLENNFTVAAPIDQTWETLLDIERVASCLPGAKIEPSEEDGVFKGAMKIKLGPMTVDYRGTAKFQDVDEDTHTASIAVQAREAKGQGTAAAVISNQLEPAGGGTRVVATTDLKITGRQAQFGRGIMEDVASSMMGEFAKRLETEIQTGSATAEQPAATNGSGQSAPGPQSAPPSAGADADEPEALDLGNVLAQTQMARYGGIAAGVLVVLGLATLLLRGRRRQLTINLNLHR